MARAALHPIFTIIDDDTRNTKSIVRNCSTNSKHLIEKGEGRVSQKTTGSLMGESI